MASELERRWNDALQRGVEVETQLAALKRAHVTLSDEQRQRLLSLGHDLPTVWHHPGAPESLKKRILRTVLHEMLIDRTAEPPGYLLHLHWQGGVHTELWVARNLPGKHRRATDLHVLDLIRELSKVCRDATTAATRNRLGYRTGTGRAWRAHSIASVRYQYRLPNFPTGKDWVTLTQAAEQLTVSETVVKRLITQGTLPASQAVPSVPWVIHRADLDLGAVQSEVQAVQAMRSRRQPVSTALPLETADARSGEKTASPTRSDPHDCA